MTTLSDDAMYGIADRLDELEAAQPVLYAALTRIAKYLASADRLKADDALEVLAAIRQAAKEATDAVDAATFAEQKRGMEEADADVMRQLAAFGYPALSAKGKLLAIAARKRAAMHEARSLREHGTKILALNAKREVDTKPHEFPSDPHTGDVA